MKTNSRTFFLRRFSALFLSLAVLLTACGGSGNAATLPTPANNLAGTSAPAGALKLTFQYGSEKQAWVEAVTKAFNASNTKAANGKPIFVETQAMGSGESMTSILEGKSQPTLWSPASSIWIPLINDEWSQKKQKDFIDQSAEPCKNLVLSPVVIMMWQPMAEALGWPNKDIGWADIAKISTSPNGWADYGKAQFGKFRFGHTHPDFSNSGLQTVIAMAYAASQPGRVLTIDDVNKPETGQFINKLESAISHYGSSTGFFADSMIARGPTYLSAAVVYESSVVSSYDQYGVQRNADFPLVAIYPKEGTFLSDHPLCIPDAAWITPDQRAAAKIYRDYLLSPPVQAQALQYGFRPSDPTVAIGAPLDKQHGVDPKQPQTVLAVPDAKTIRKVRDLWQAQKRQVNLTLLIDISGSMKDDNKMAGARQGAQAFIDLLDEKDNLTIIAFDDKQDILVQNQNVGTNRASLKKAVGELIPRGGTALFDSIAIAVKSLKVDPTRINAVVVMTDGQDNNSTKYKDARSLLSILGRGTEGTDTPDISIFTIGYGKDADAQVLGTIAKGAGGKYSSGSTSDIGQVFRDIATFF